MKARNEQGIADKIERYDKKIFRREKKKTLKQYNMMQAARVLGVHRQTLYYWIKKGWVTPKRDYKNYPVFTVLDIKKMIKWKNMIQ